MPKTINSTNPANFEIIGTVKASSKKEITNKVNLANLAKYSWGQTSVEERKKYVEKLYRLCKQSEKQIAEIITKEVGTPTTEGRDEVNWNWSYIEWFIANAKRAVSAETSFQDESSIHQIYYEPIGTAAVITPWNLPFDLFIWGVIPNLLVGNTVIYKASEECVLTGKLLEEIVSKAGFPKGTFSFIHGDAVEGKYLTEQEVDFIWFTGSSEVGTLIYKLAGKKFIKVVLEMGGSNPVIIFEDADIDALLDNVLSKRFMFCGQTCDADKRLIVHKTKYDEFINKFVHKVESLIVGDPEKLETQIGPLVSQKQLDLLVSQVEDAIKKGAKVLCGGKSPKDFNGAYYLPTVLTNINREMRIWKEEVFGPVLPIATFSSEEEAISLANDTSFGLGSQIFTKDKDKIDRVVSKVKAGNVDVNGIGHFKPFNPFGGYKYSGMGREHGIYGFRELCQLKTVSIKK